MGKKVKDETAGVSSVAKVPLEIDLDGVVLMFQEEASGVDSPTSTVPGPAPDAETPIEYVVSGDEISTPGIGSPVVAMPAAPAPVTPPQMGWGEWFLSWFSFGVEQQAQEGADMSALQLVGIVAAAKAGSSMHVY